MRILLTTLLSLSLVINCLAQQPVFHKSYGAGAFERFRSIAPTSDGGFIAAGESTGIGNGNIDIFIVKTDSMGDTLWTNLLGGSDADWACSVQEVSPGQYLITGTTKSFGAGNEDVYLALLNSSGDTVFTRTYGDADPQYIVANSTKAEKTYEGGYIIAATAYDSGYAVMHIYIIKTDSAGNQVWAKKYAGSFVERAWAMQKTADSSYLITGVAVVGFSGNSDVFLLKIDGAGNVIWGKTYDSAGMEEGFSLSVLANGDCIIFGSTTSNNSNGYTDMMLMRLDVNGNILWSNVYANPGNISYAGSIVVDAGGNFVLAGTKRTLTNDLSALVMKTDGAGTLQWAKEFGGSGMNESYMSVGRCLDGTYILGGATDTYGAGNTDGLISRIGPNGESACNMTTPVIIVSQTTLTSSTFAPQVSNLGAATGTTSGRFHGTVPMLICSSHVNISEATAISEIRVYPNPAHTILVASYVAEEPTRTSTLSITDILGNQVYAISFAGVSMEIDVTSFAPGVYFLRIQDGEIIHNEKIVIE